MLLSTSPRASGSAPFGCDVRCPVGELGVIASRMSRVKAIRVAQLVWSAFLQPSRGVSSSSTPDRPAGTMRARSRAPVVALFIMSLATFLGAQQSPAPLVGARVKFDLVSQGAGAGAQSRYSCQGAVAGGTADTVLITPLKMCTINGSVRHDVAGLQIETGNRGYRIVHFLYGVVAGAVTGGLTGLLLAGDGCRVKGCDDGGYAVGMAATAGIAVGGIIGGAIGLVLPAGRTWRPLPRVDAVLVPEKTPAP